MSILIMIVFFVFYKNEKTQVLKAYSSDTKNTVFTEYEIRDSDTILHGSFKRFNEKNIKIAEGKFVNNDIFGKCSYYYDDGKIEVIHYRKNSDVTLESNFYDKLGFVKSYVMHNAKGEPLFYVDFNRNKIIKHEGIPISEEGQFVQRKGKIIEITDNEILKIGDTIQYKYIVANIPLSKKSIKFKTDNFDNSKINRKISKKMPTEIIVNEILVKKGLNRINASVKYEFEDKSINYFNYTISFDLNVE